MFLGVRRWIWLAFLGIAIVGLILVAYQRNRDRNAARLQAECLVARKSENWPELEQLAVAWGLIQPTRFEPFLLAAQAAEQQGDKVRTASYLLEMPDDAPIEALLQLGLLQFEELNDPLGSIRTCEKVLQRDSKNSEAHERLLFFWTMTQSATRIRQEALRGIRHGSATIVTYAYLFGAEKLRFRDAKETNRHWLESNPKEELFLVPTVLNFISSFENKESSTPNEDSDLAQRQSKVDADLNQLWKEYPSNSEVIAALLEREIQRGNIETVESILRNAVAISAIDNRYWRAKGWLHSNRMEYEEALVSYDRAIRLAPMDWQTFHERANVDRQLGDLNAIENDTRIAVLGGELTQQLNLATSIFSLERVFYERLANFAELCDQPGIASGIRAQLPSYVPSNTIISP